VCGSSGFSWITCENGMLSPEAGQVEPGIGGRSACAVLRACNMVQHGATSCNIVQHGTALLYPL